jgi:hypothetical protein
LPNPKNSDPALGMDPAITIAIRFWKLTAP